MSWRRLFYYKGVQLGTLSTCGCVVYRLTFLQAAKQGCRLELRFRPEDNLCKPAFAKPEKVTNLVFKIRKRRIQQSSDMNQPTAQPLFEYAVSVLGIVDTQFEFTGELFQVCGLGDCM